MTTGIAALGSEAVANIVQTIEVYDDLCHANDPYEEHDFGSFEADGHTIFFKIDYYAGKGGNRRLSRQRICAKVRSVRKSSPARGLIKCSKGRRSRRAVVVHADTAVVLGLRLPHRACLPLIAADAVHWQHDSRGRP